MNLLEIQNLSVSFPTQKDQRLVLDNLNFTVFRGETLGIVGESGSGKSLTSLAIMRLLPATAIINSGNMIWTEQGTETNLLELPEKAMYTYRGKKISMIFQEPLSALNPIMKCGKQVEESLAVHNIVEKSKRKEEVIYWFEKVGLPEPLRIYDSYPHQLSGGQLQRILIAMALCTRPQLLIADEPTTALDVTIQKQILELLDSLKKELNLTIIFISHDLGVIRQIADRVLVMMKGKLVESGTVEHIFYNASHYYTKGLILCRPPLNKKLKRLATIQDFVGQDNYVERVYSQSELAAKAKEIQSNGIILSANNISVDYVKKRNFWGKAVAFTHAVKPSSFEIKYGQILGLVGESGSGKSTLGRAILKLTPATTGSIIHNKVDLLQLNDAQWRPYRKQFQIIFQDPYSSLNPRKQIGSAIVEPMQVHHLHNTDKERKEKVIHLLEEVGLQADHFNRYPHQFSGGQRQRICIARALALSPKFIVCDESVSALDVSVQAQVLNLLLDLKDKFDLSYLFISHDLSVIHFLCDQVMVMQHGEIVERGDTHQIIHNPTHPYTQRLIEAIPKYN